LTKYPTFLVIPLDFIVSILKIHKKERKRAA